MAKGQNAQRNNKELWKRRPMSGYDSDSENKTMSHRIERRTNKHKHRDLTNDNCSGD